MSIECDVCGNKRETTNLLCPFCGNKADLSALEKQPLFVHKTVNLEAGRPALDVALHLMNEIIEDSIRNNVTVLTFIHGYGSSGKGGVIRSECRKNLDFLKQKGLISNFIAGEDFNKRSGLVKSLIQRYPQLGADKHLNKGNRGITLVIITYGLLLLSTLVLTTTFNATFWS